MKKTVKSYAGINKKWWTEDQVFAWKLTGHLIINLAGDNWGKAPTPRTTIAARPLSERIPSRDLLLVIMRAIEIPFVAHHMRPAYGGVAAAGALEEVRDAIGRKRFQTKIANGRILYRAEEVKKFWPSRYGQGKGRPLKFSLAQGEDRLLVQRLAGIYLLANEHIAQGRAFELLQQMESLGQSAREALSKDSNRQLDTETNDNAGNGADAHREPGYNRFQKIKKQALIYAEDLIASDLLFGIITAAEAEELEKSLDLQS